MLSSITKLINLGMRILLFSVINPFAEVNTSTSCYITTVNALSILPVNVKIAVLVEKPALKSGCFGERNPPFQVGGYPDGH